MINIIFLSGNIELNHTVIVSNIVYIYRGVWFAGQLVKIVLNGA